MGTRQIKGSCDDDEQVEEGSDGTMFARIQKELRDVQLATNNPKHLLVELLYDILLKILLSVV